MQTLSTALDGQIKGCIDLLVRTREKLIETPATEIEPISQRQQQITYAELLSYAKRISKFTLPSDHREEGGAGTGSPTRAVRTGSGDDGAKTAGEEAVGAAATAGSAVTANGTNAKGADDAKASATDPLATTIGLQMPPELRDSLNPHLNYSFTPYPDLSQLRLGAFGNVQSLTERGVDLEGWEADAEAEAL